MQLLLEWQQPGCSNRAAGSVGAPATGGQQVGRQAERAGRRTSYGQAVELGQLLENSGVDGPRRVRVVATKQRHLHIMMVGCVGWAGVGWAVGGREI